MKTPSKFEQLWKLGYTDLIPIIPANATLSEHTKVSEANKGKVPGKKTPRGWVGFSKWQEYQTETADLAVWHGWGAGIGLKTGNIFAIDIDITNSEISDKVAKWFTNRLGHAPERTGRAPKRLLVYACVSELHKRRVVFLDKEGKEHAVELLGKGQQFVCHGIHPSGRRYSWDTPSKTLPPVHDLTEFTFEQIDEVWDLLLAYLTDELGLELKDSSSNAAAARVDFSHLAASDPEMVREALKSIPNDLNYDNWIKMCAAIKAALNGNEDHYDIFEDWCAQYEGNTAADIRKRWDSITASSLGANYLFDHARDHGFNYEADSFAADPDWEPDVQSEILNARDGLFTRYIWCEEVKRFIDTETGHLLDRDTINMRESVAGNPASSKANATMVFMRDNNRKRTVWGVTYRPGGPEIVTEPKGECYNTWRPSDLSLPGVVRDDEVALWLQLAEHVIPDPEARGIILDWAAHTLTRPELKCNWAVLLGSTTQGIGKDMLFQPLIHGVGQLNTRYIGPADIASGYTDWAANSKLIVVEEMHAFDRKETMNKLKAFIAAPPNYIRINTKYVPQYDIPNVGSYLFFSNIHNALALEREDRRFYVYWPAQKRESRFYQDIMHFYTRQNGLAKVIRWLSQRDLSAFDYGGSAPWSEDKEEMRRAGQDPISEWIENCIDDGEAPFDTVVAIQDIMARLPSRIERLKPSVERITHIMRSNGAKNFGKIYAKEHIPGVTTRQIRLYAIRRIEMHMSIEREFGKEAIARKFWEERKKEVDKSAADFLDS